MQLEQDEGNPQGRGLGENHPGLVLEGVEKSRALAQEEPVRVVGVRCCIYLCDLLYIYVIVGNPSEEPVRVLPAGGALLHHLHHAAARCIPGPRGARQGMTSASMQPEVDAKAGT